MQGPFRLESEYYRKEYLELERKISQIKCDKLEDISDKISDGTHFTPSYTETGIPFLSALNVLENRVDLEVGHQYISREAHELLCKRCDPTSGDILLRKVGVGARLASVIPQSLPEFSIFVSVALLRLKKNSINPYYLSTFINTQLGQKQLLRIQKGASQPDLHLEDIAELMVPVLSTRFQKRVEELVLQSNRIRSEGSGAWAEAERTLYRSVGIGDHLFSSANRTVKMVSDSFLSSGRLDAEFYLPKFDELEGIIKSGRHSSLNKLQTYNSRGVPAKYEEDGTVGMITQKNILEVGIDYTNVERTSLELYGKDETVLTKKNDILIYGTGANIGRSQVYLASEKAIPCQDIIVLRVTNNPIYTAFVLNSKIGRMQTEKFRTGSAQPHLYPKDIEQFMIPIVESEAEAQIVKNVTSALRKRDLSRDVVAIARSAVETAIETSEVEALRNIEVQMSLVDASK